MSSKNLSLKRILCAILVSASVCTNALAQQLVRQSDEEIAGALMDCDAALVAMDGLSAALKLPIDRDRLIKSRTIARRGAIALVGLQSAKEKYEASRVRVKDELAQALVSGTPAVEKFVQGHIARCAAVAGANAEYIAQRIAEEQARRDAASR